MPKLKPKPEAVLITEDTKAIYNDIVARYGMRDLNIGECAEVLNCDRSTVRSKLKGLKYNISGRAKLFRAAEIAQRKAQERAFNVY